MFLDGAQNYPQCFNIAITGSGTDKPAGTLGVNLYKANDPYVLPGVVFLLSPGPQKGPPSPAISLDIEFICL